MLSACLGTAQMQPSQLKRREFITLLGGAVAAWPLAAHAQQPAMPVIGFLYGASPDPVAHRLRAFRQGLKDSGYVEGENVAIEYRWAESQFDRLPEMVADLIRRQVTVIAALNTVVAVAAKAASTTIPIVFGVGEDPVRLGLVASLARPGGNATGINNFISELAAKRWLQIQVVNASTSGEIDAAFAAFVREQVDALFIGPGGFFSSRRVHIANQAMRHGIPATYSQREFPEIGGLMSYGTNLTDNWRQVRIYAG